MTVEEQQKADLEKQEQEAAAKKAEEEKAAQEQAAKLKEQAPDYQQVLRGIEELKRQFTDNPEKNKELVDKHYEDLEEKTGLKREAVEWIQQATSHIVNSVYTRVKTGEDSGKIHVSSILGDNTSSLMSEVEKIMASQTSENRANPEVWKSAAYMVKGMNADKFTAKAQPAINNGGARATGGNVPGLNPPSGGSSTSSSGKQYSDQEKEMIRRYFDGDEKDYEKFDSTKRIYDIKSEKELNPAPKF